jgi:hypothetical protein
VQGTLCDRQRDPRPLGAALLRLRGRVYRRPLRVLDKELDDEIPRVAGKALAESDPRSWMEGPQPVTLRKRWLKAFLGGRVLTANSRVSSLRDFAHATSVDAVSRDRSGFLNGRAGYRKLSALRGRVPSPRGVTRPKAAFLAPASFCGSPNGSRVPGRGFSAEAAPVSWARSAWRPWVEARPLKRTNNAPISPVHLHQGEGLPPGRRACACPRRPQPNIAPPPSPTTVVLTLYR